MTLMSPRCAKLYINAVDTLRGPDQRQIGVVMKQKSALMCVPSQIGGENWDPQVNLTKLGP